MKYTWIDFDLAEAIRGALVGIPETEPQPGGTIDEDIKDISKVAGNLSQTDKNSRYKVVISGQTAYIDADGTVVSSTPSSAYIKGTQMYIATATIEPVVGSTITRSDGAEEEYDANVTLTNMEPRDTFAIQILSAMLVHSGKPETFDDANIKMYASAAYRWAQGMMDVAANTRHGQSESTSPSAPINVKSEDLQSNTEKLLYNMAEYMKSGVTVKGTTSATPVQTNVTGVPNLNVATLPNVTIGQMPDIAIDSIPNIYISHLPEVDVDSMPKIVLGNQPTGTITIDPSTLQTAEEKLLYNIVLYMKATMQ